MIIKYNFCILMDIDDCLSGNRKLDFTSITIPL